MNVSSDGWLSAAIHLSWRIYTHTQMHTHSYTLIVFFSPTLTLWSWLWNKHWPSFPYSRINPVIRRPAVLCAWYTFGWKLSRQKKNFYMPFIRLWWSGQSCCSIRTRNSSQPKRHMKSSFVLSGSSETLWTTLHLFSTMLRGNYSIFSLKILLWLQVLQKKGKKTWYFQNKAEKNNWKIFVSDAVVGEYAGALKAVEINVGRGIVVKIGHTILTYIRHRCSSMLS